MARWVWFLLTRRHFSLTSALRLVRIWFAYSRGRLPYDDFSKLAAHAYAEGIAGRDVSTTCRLAQAFVASDRKRLFRFVHDLVSVLQKHELRIVVVSGAPQVVLEQYREVVRFHGGYGLVVHETDGVWRPTPEPSPAIRAVKQTCIDRVRSEGYEVVLALGDSEADAPLLLAAKIKLRYVRSRAARGSDWPPGTEEVTADTVVQTVEAKLDELLGDGAGPG